MQEFAVADQIREFCDARGRKKFTALIIVGLRSRNCYVIRVIQLSKALVTSVK